ncbi:hypothetical protein Q5N42_00765 [Vibrio cholerae]|uniref:hypothetical protein n=1 Tax=Vibrio cholerae TaxID=666 RepID=UPI0029369E9E|nr:hypothetical protein [Vibrio cholerae]
MPHNISLNNITPMTAPAQQELSDISLQTTASVLPRVETQPNMSEPALPQTLSLTDSCLENEETSSNQQSEVKKEQAEKKKKVHKKSNKYSNHTKAKGHLAAIAGATTLGAVLAPFTGGLSLLPTAFVVLFGNATALAMYGGSEFVLGQQGANNQLEDKKEPEENKQPEDLVPLPPRPMPTYEFHGFDEIDGRRIPDDNEPGEKGADGKGNTFNYSPVFNFNLNFGDLNINQFNTQNNTQNNTYNVNQGGTNPQPTLIEQAIERFGEHPVISVVEITKETLIRELRGQEPIIGSEPEIDEMVDALVSFHEQTNEAKLIQVNFEGGHKAYIGGIPETEELPDVQPVKAEVVVEKEKKQWPEVKPAHRLITTSGNATVASYSGYQNAKVVQQGHTIGYANVENIAKNPQVASTLEFQKVNENQDRKQLVEHSSEQNHVQQGVDGQVIIDSANMQKVTGQQVKKWPEVAPAQRVITSAGNAKVDGNPGYANSRIEVNGQTVGYARSERVGSQSQLAGDARSIATDSHDVEQGQVTTENRSTQSSVESSSTQTSVEQNSVTTQTFVENGTQTEAETSPVKGHHTLQGVAAERVTEGAQVEHAQTNGVKKWPEVAAPQRVITSAGNAKVDGNPGYANSRIEVNGQTVGYARSERVGGQSQLAGDARSIATDSHGVEQGQVTTENRSTQSSVESSSTQTSVEQNSVTTQTFAENGTQTEAETSPVNGHHTLQGVAAERVTEGAQVEHAQTNGVKKWPEVAAPQRVITSAGNAKVDGNPGYANSRIEVDGQTVGYARSERVGSQSQLAGDARSIATDSHDVEQGQVTTENRSTQSSVESSSTQTSVEQNSVTTQTFVENGTQTEAETSPVKGYHTLQGVAAERMVEGAQVEHAQVSVTNIQPEISSQFEVGKNDSQQIQGNAAKVWPEVVPSQRVITSAGNAKVDGNPGYQNSKVDIAGSTYGYQRAERLSSQNSLFEGVNLPQTHQEAEGIKSGSTDVTKLVDVTALPSASETNQSEPRRFVSKLHITLKGKSSADNNPMNTQAQHETLQSWSSNLVSHAPNMKQAQKIVVQQAQNDTELQPKVANLEATKAPTIVSNITGKKWTVTMPTPVLTTQGMASGRGKNYTQGLFHNIRDINLTKKQLESSLPLMEIAQKRDVSVVTMGERVLPVKPAEISNLKLAS